MTILPLTANLLVEYQESYISTMNALVPTQYDDIQPLLEQFVAMTQQGTHIYIAIDDLHGIVGSISLLIEAKMIRGGVQAGHIEDLVVHECAQ